MDEEKLLALAAVGQDEVERLSQQLGKPVSVDMSALVMLARIAMHQPDDGPFHIFSVFLTCSHTF